MECAMLPVCQQHSWACISMCECVWMLCVLCEHMATYTCVQTCVCTWVLRIRYEYKSILCGYEYIWARVSMCSSECVSTMQACGGALTLAFVGTVCGCWPPWLLVEAGAAAVTGAPTRIVLAGALKPIGDTWAQEGLRPTRDPEGPEKGSGCVGTSWRTGARAEHGMVSACGPPDHRWAWALGPSGSSYNLPITARTQAKSAAFLGQLWGLGLAQQAALGSARRPYYLGLLPRGKWPRTASSSSRGWTPVKGLESSLLSWRAAPAGSVGRGTAGCSWGLSTEPPFPSAHTSTTQSKGEQEEEPHPRAMCASVLDQYHSAC